jgi:hypothetical protein
MYLDLLDIDLSAILRAHSDCWAGALCDDYSPGALGVLLGPVGDALRNLLDVLRLDVVRLGECGGFSLVADEDVDVGQDLVERILEELCDEWGGKVEDEELGRVSMVCLLSFVCTECLPCSLLQPPQPAP